ncbi:hypothetical protein CRE79_004577 [Escherichia coli]|nr:hypothetical protein [Escherichia coli]
MNERLKTHSKTQKKSADLVSNKLRIGVFQRYQMKCKSVSKKSPRYIQQEHLLFTPLFKADNARCFDLEVESSTGVAQYADRLFLSATTDGINYGREQMIEQNEPFVYDKRVLWKRVGRIRKNVGFKLRVITKSPVTLSGAQIRIE